ncbi:hypothetical protein, partial [Klebsiella pneumoniae]|uniref:hypothetical protein n=1 Tax=Klebsiella pneumoniae TaxID=573 RepID=UPI0025A1CB09
SKLVASPTKPATQAFVISVCRENDEHGQPRVLFSCLYAMANHRMNSHSVISFFYLLILS